MDYTIGLELCIGQIVMTVLCEGWDEEQVMVADRC